MFTPARFLGLVILGLSVGLFALAEPPPRERPVRSGVAAILKLAENLEGKSVSLQARSIVQEYEDTCQISVVFSMKRLGGVGIGSAVQAGHKDSIEHLVRDWSGAKPPTREELQTHQKDLLRVARVLKAMAELAPHRMFLMSPRDSKGKAQTAEDWRQMTRDFKESTRDLHDAVEDRAPASAREAAVRLQQTCYTCHKLVSPNAGTAIRGGN